ncbi:MAG: FAD-dependent oxidoreductase [Desulfacinum sp.]|nr:FAD-dependent oxidoreductase [Desulfacinum sp.]
MADQNALTPLFTVQIATFPGASLDEAEAVREAFVKELERRSARDLTPIHVTFTGWHGIEGKDVMVRVQMGQEVSLYQMVTPDMAGRIVEQHLLGGRPVTEWLAGRDLEAFHQPQKQVVSQWTGTIDPTDLQAYRDQDGYDGYLHFAREGFQRFLDLVKPGELRDGATLDGRPMVALWREALERAGKRAVVVNACTPAWEAGPELLLLEGVPHQVLEGALLASGVLAADRILFLVPRQARTARERLGEALRVLLQSDLLDISGHKPSVEIAVSEHVFLNEDEASLRRALGAQLPAHVSLVVHGVEAVAVLPLPAQRVLYGQTSITDPSDYHTRIFRLSGPVVRPGFVEVAVGAPLAQVVDQVGGGPLPGHRPKALWVGGAVGGVFPMRLAELSLDHETLRGLGACLSVGQVRLLDDRECVVAQVTESFRRLMAARMGRCAVFDVEAPEILKILEAVTEGRATSDSLPELERRCTRVREEASGALLRNSVNPILTSLQFFHEEYRMHTENRHCPARVCARLIPAPCQMACPTSIDIPSYLAHVAHGEPAKALEVIRHDNPFPWVCGLICPHPCERACVRGHLDQPINIRYLKAYAAQWAEERNLYDVVPPAEKKPQKVAVVGSGPAGLAAAHYLASMGYPVTIFEANPIPGGLLVTGIPEYRLPRSVVRKEIQLLERLGVEIRTGVTVGEDVTLDELRDQGYKAFFLGIGAHQSYQLKIEGEAEYPQVMCVIRFLREVNLGQRTKPADKVVVVGGGNAAMDAARTCIRLGCKEVHVAYRRTLEQMPAHSEEVRQAMEEGVQFHFLAVPVKVVGENGRVTHLECLQARLGKPDASGRRRPIPVAGSNFRIEAGAVIRAIGQQPKLSSFGEDLPFQVTPRNLIVTEPYSTRTSVEDIFAGGDAVTGPATVVEAIAAGKQAALDIDHYLQGRQGPAPVFRAHRRDQVPFVAQSAKEKRDARRVPLHLVDPEVRKHTFDPVELGYSDEEARAEARRCLRCDVCIRCGTCERVCRDDMQVHALGFSQISTTERVLTDYERPSEKCITCGACALACPTGAIQFEERDGRRRVSLCGTELNALDVPACKACGKSFVPKRYLDYVQERADAATGKRVFRNLCPECARRVRAERFWKA